MDSLTLSIGVCHWADISVSPGGVIEYTITYKTYRKGGFSYDVPKRPQSPILLSDCCIASLSSMRSKTQFHYLWRRFRTGPTVARQKLSGKRRASTVPPNCICKARGTAFFDCAIGLLYRFHRCNRK